MNIQRIRNLTTGILHTEMKHIYEDDDMNSLERSKIHADLCKKLFLDYNEFQPFESSEIKKIPTRKESEWILWKAIGIELDKRLEEHQIKFS